MAQNEHRPTVSARATTAQRHQGLREELLAVARAAIESHGLEQLRIRDLATSAGCSLGAIYNVFTDLDDLILAVNGTTLSAIDREMGAIQETDPLVQCLALAAAYLGYAMQNRRLWEALSSYRLPQDKTAPGWFLALQDAAFSHIEAPLARLCPAMPIVDRHLLGRSIFAAVHGMVALGIDQRLAPTALPVLQEQIALLVRAMIRGLSLTAGEY